MIKQLPPHGEAILRVIVEHLRKGHVIPNDPRTFISYKAIHDILHLPLIGRTYGESLSKQGLAEIAEWAYHKGLPAITGLVIDKESLRPGDGYFKLYSQENNFIWWETEVEKSLEFDWEPYLSSSITKHKNERGEGLPHREVRTYWWQQNPGEKYWVEITDRKDIGADLKCPQTDESGKAYWSYSLIRSVWPGDIVFHYSTPIKTFVGASVAGGPLEERPIKWIPHGTYGRSKEEHAERPGWWLPLYGHVQSSNPLKLADVQEPENQLWVTEWIRRKQQESNVGVIAAPFQLYPGKLRAQQGYLTKMPLEFVRRWNQLSSLVDALRDKEDELVKLAESYPPINTLGSFSTSSFKPKSAEEYLALIRGGLQRRSRNHEHLVKTVAEFFQKKGAVISNPHPIDLLMTSPAKVIFEAKLTNNRSAGFAIREAVGQLFEYRHFIGPGDANLCILLNDQPDEPFIRYVEDILKLMIIWSKESDIYGGSATTQMFLKWGITL